MQYKYGFTKETYVQLIDFFECVKRYSDCWIDDKVMQDTYTAFMGIEINLHIFPVIQGFIAPLLWDADCTLKDILKQLEILIVIKSDDDKQLLMDI